LAIETRDEALPHPGDRSRRALLGLALGLAACGEKSEDVTGKTQPLSLTLDFSQIPTMPDLHGAESWLLQKKPGRRTFASQPPSGIPRRPIKLVAAGQTDLSISYERSPAAKNRALTCSAVGALVNRPD